MRSARVAVLSLVFAFAAISTGSYPSARADALALEGGSSGLSASPLTFGHLVGGSHGGGGFNAPGTHGGPLLAVEGAWATTLPVYGDPSHAAWAFGVRGGWALANGLSVHVRYDDLGVEPHFISAPLQLASAGLRYSLPFVVPLPFAEVDAGPAIVGGDVRLGGGVGLGASVPIGPFVLVDLVGHDWLIPVVGTLRQTPTMGLGLTVTFAGPPQ